MKIIITRTQHGDWEVEVAEGDKSLKYGTSLNTAEDALSEAQEHLVPLFTN